MNEIEVFKNSEFGEIRTVIVAFSALIAELRTSARTTPGERVWRGQKDHCTECATGAENKSIWESGFARSAESRASKIYQKSTSSSHGNRTTTECLQKGVRDNVLSGTERIERSRTSGRGNDISGSFWKNDI